MKKLLFIAISVGFFSAHSQITNIFPDDGNAGIGTTTPTEKLEVVGTTLTDRMVIENASNGFALQMGEIVYLNRRRINFTTFNSRMAFSMMSPTGQEKFNLNFNDTQGFLQIKNYNSTVDAFKLASTSDLGNFMHMPSSNSRVVIGGYGDYLFNDGHKFVVKNGSAMIEGNILTNSSIGIGTSLFVDGGDTYKLSVNGKVRANSVKVYTDWADYVFMDDYKLPTLEEVEKFIKENGHLQDIPSAKEVEDSGIELGEMNKLLLQKVEELTLYLIEKDKQIQILTQRLDTLMPIKN